MSDTSAFIAEVTWFQAYFYFVKKEKNNFCLLGRHKEAAYVNWKHNKHSNTGWSTLSADTDVTLYLF